jgi:hypothetical protein
LLTDLKSWKILSELQINESNKLVLVVNVLSTQLNSEVDKLAILRCSLMGYIAEYADAKLVKILDCITEILTNNYSWSVSDFWFGVYKITEAGLSPPMMDDKQRNIRTKDLYLYYLI